MLLSLRDVGPEEQSSEYPLLYHGTVIVQKRLENAGWAFFNRFEKIVEDGSNLLEETAAAASGEVDNEGFEDVRDEAAWFNKQQERRSRASGNAASAPNKLKKLLEGPNLYDVLGVDEAASVALIKKRYRTLCLEYHPDKQEQQSSKSGAGTPSQQNEDTSTPEGRCAKILGNVSLKEAFLLVQSAYEVLSVPEMRRQYDGALPFDETIPSEKQVVKSDPAAFFEMMQPVFKKNARWSARKPVPDIGTDSTPIRDVKRFYSFWESFQSIRDFSVHDAYDLGDAECRDERRWMERENARSRRPFVNKEKERIAELVRLAKSNDPRLKRERETLKTRKEEQYAAREAESKQKAEAALLAEQKRLDAEASERAQREAERLVQLEAKKQLQQRTRQCRAKFRRCCRSLVESNLLSTEDIVNDVALNTPIEDLEAMVEQMEAGGASSEPNSAMAALVEKKWLAWLAEEQKKREEAEERARQKSVVSNKTANASLGQKIEREWTAEELGLLARGLQRFPGGTPRRWELIAKLVGTRTHDDVILQTKRMADGRTLKSMGARLAEQQVATNSKTPSDSAGLPKRADETPTVWTDAQQKALETALRTYPASIGNKERWIAVAQAVPGKTPKECVARFKEIRAAILRQQG